MADERKDQPASIWLLTAGADEDYHVVGVFSTQPLAEAAQALHDERFPEWITPAYAARIEEYELDGPTWLDPKAGGWRAQVNSEGDVLEASWNESMDPHAPAVSETIDSQYSFTGYGVTRARARRSAEELRSAWASGNVVEPPPDGMAADS